jgi:hypothetical protein
MISSKTGGTDRGLERDWAGELLPGRLAAATDPHDRPRQNEVGRGAHIELIVGNNAPISSFIHRVFVIFSHNFLPVRLELRGFNP